MPHHCPGWVNMLLRSKNPITKAKGEAIKSKLKREYEQDVRNYLGSPGYRSKHG